MGLFRHCCFHLLIVESKRKACPRCPSPCVCDISVLNRRNMPFVTRHDSSVFSVRQGTWGQRVARLKVVSRTEGGVNPYALPVSTLLFHAHPSTFSLHHRQHQGRERGEKRGQQHKSSETAYDGNVSIGHYTPSARRMGTGTDDFTK